MDQNAYSQYGNNAQPTNSREIQNCFYMVDKDRSGQINGQELQAALLNGQGSNFSDIACEMMIKMFDRDKTGTIDINQFQHLYTYVCQWLKAFRTFDRDQSGRIEEEELIQAFQQMGYRFSQDFVKYLLKLFDTKTHSQITVDQFIIIAVKIQQFTEIFRAKDKEMKGAITLGFEEFLEILINCSMK